MSCHLKVVDSFVYFIIFTMTDVFIFRIFIYNIVYHIG